MSDYNEKAIRILESISDLAYGQVELTPSYDRVEFCTWYVSGGTAAEEVATNLLLDRLFAGEFEVERYRDIGHTQFTGHVDGLTVAVRTGRGVFCERVKVGRKVVPAEPARPRRTEDVYEWQCADPIAAVAS